MTAIRRCQFAFVALELVVLAVLPLHRAIPWFDTENDDTIARDVLEALRWIGLDWRMRAAVPFWIVVIILQLLSVFMPLVRASIGRRFDRCIQETMIDFFADTPLFLRQSVYDVCSFTSAAMAATETILYFSFLHGLSGIIFVVGIVFSALVCRAEDRSREHLQLSNMAYSGLSRKLRFRWIPVP